MPSSLEIQADIRNISSSGPTNVDFRISDSQIQFWIDETRSMLINQAIQKKKDISDIWIQSIGCLPLIVVDMSECCSIPSGCDILRSSIPIPPTVEPDDLNLLMKVSGIDGTSIAKINSFRARFKQFNRFTGQTPGWFIENEYLYIINTDLTLGNVSLRGIFERPSDLAGYSNCNSLACWSLESNYPCSLKMANEITNIVFQTKVRPYMTIHPDLTNDNKDETGPMGRIKF